MPFTFRKARKIYWVKICVLFRFCHFHSSILHDFLMNISGHLHIPVVNSLMPGSLLDNCCPDLSYFGKNFRMKH